MKTSELTGAALCNGANNIPAAKRLPLLPMHMALNLARHIVQKAIEGDDK